MNVFNFEIFDSKIMKLLIKILTLCIFCLNGYASMYAQSLDFDSLYQHDIEYKQAIKSAYKSLDFFDQEGVINISIESDFKNLVKHKWLYSR